MVCIGFTPAPVTMTTQFILVIRARERSGPTNNGKQHNNRRPMQQFLRPRCRRQRRWRQRHRPIQHQRNAKTINVRSQQRFYLFRFFLFIRMVWFWFVRSFVDSVWCSGGGGGCGNSIRRRLNLIYADKTKNLRMSFILCRTVNEDVLFRNALAYMRCWLVGCHAEETDDTEKRDIKQEAKPEKEGKRKHPTHDIRMANFIVLHADGGCSCLGGNCQPAIVTRTAERRDKYDSRH